TYKRNLLFIYVNEYLTINMDLERKNRSYTIAFKLEVIKYAEDSSNHRAAKFYNVDRKRVQEWRKQKEKLEPVKNKVQVRALKGRG
ncbi:3852_t:CDS:1, partial [Gigaspora rosea]